MGQSATNREGVIADWPAGVKTALRSWASPCHLSTPQPHSRQAGNQQGARQGRPWTGWTLLDPMQHLHDLDFASAQLQTWSTSAHPLPIAPFLEPLPAAGPTKHFILLPLPNLYERALPAARTIHQQAPPVAHRAFPLPPLPARLETTTRRRAG